MRWRIESKTHEHCKECAECAAEAIKHGNETEAVRATSALTNGVGEGAVTLHQAVVVLTDA